MKYLVSAAVVEGVSWCKECDYVTFEVVHPTDQLAYGSFLPFSQRSTSNLQQSERKTDQSILHSKRIPEIYILSGYVATVWSAKVKMWTGTRSHFRNLNLAIGNYVWIPNFRNHYHMQLRVLLQTACHTLGSRLPDQPDISRRLLYFLEWQIACDKGLLKA